MYSLAILFSEIFTREVPFDGLDVPAIRTRVLDGTRPVLRAVPSPKWKVLVEKMWGANPADRPDAASVLKEIVTLCQA